MVRGVIKQADAQEIVGWRQAILRTNGPAPRPEHINGKGAGKISHTDLALLPPWVHAFDLKANEWKLIEVDSIKPVAWNHDTWKNLVLPKKDLTHSFISKRQKTGPRFDDFSADKGLSRNEIVSIFLRRLEYYPGVLILTTNRMTQIDPAFESRIDIIFPYTDLPVHARRESWVTFLRATLPQDTGSSSVAAIRAATVPTTTTETTTTTATLPAATITAVGTTSPPQTSEPGPTKKLSRTTNNIPSSPTIPIITTTTSPSTPSTSSHPYGSNPPILARIYSSTPQPAPLSSSNTRPLNPTTTVPPELSHMRTPTRLNKLAALPLNGRQIKNLVKLAHTLGDGAVDFETVYGMGIWKVEVWGSQSQGVNSLL